MSQRFAIRVYHKLRLEFSDEFETGVELGRQRSPDEEPFVKRSDGLGWRVSIARLDQPQISRRHIRLEPLPDRRVRVTNVSDRNTIHLEDGGLIAGRQSSDLPLPVSLIVGEKSIHVDPVGAPDFEEPEIHSLATPTIAPGKFGRGRLSGALALSAPTNEAGEEFVSWLQAVTSMLSSSASAKDFFERAAQGIVEFIALDSGAVLLREGNGWNIVEFRSSRRGVSVDSWRPSNRILTRVVEQKRTFWQVLGESLAGTASLGEIQAVVAAPILSYAGEVVAVLYGDRVPGSGGAAAGIVSISKLEAMLVETLACSVAAGLGRIEQEKKILAAQVRFEQFFTPELAGQLAVEPDLLRGRDALVTLLFCDIRGFSRFSERLGPAVTVEWISSVLNALSDSVIAHKGVLVDYMGDELMAMWGTPLEQPDQAQLACRTALDMWNKLPELNARWHAVLKEPIQFGIGINTGVARVGNTGSDRKFKYGPLGNTVNLASRIQGATKYLKAGILVSAATRGRLDAGFRTRRLCEVRVVNISEPVELHELMTNDGPAWVALCERYEAALHEYGRQNFRQAAKILGNILDENPDDGPAVVLLSRVVDRLVNPTSEFKPAWDLPGK